MARDYYLDHGQSVEADSGWYQILKEIGEGGNCVTYLATNTETNSDLRGNNFAIKLFRNTFDDKRTERFRQERQFLQKTTHPSILRYYDQGEYQGYPMLVSEYLPSTLRDIIDNNSMPFTQKLAYAVQILSALVHLEKQDTPIVHRDIKPENIFIRGEVAYLGDFGLMKRTETDEGSRNESEEKIEFYSSMAMNKYQYRSPDLVKRENGVIDKIPTESDVFQLGLVLTELFTDTNWNPQVPKSNPLSEVELEGHVQDWIRVPEGMGSAVASIIQDMLKMDYQKRKKATELMDPWMGVYKNAIKKEYDVSGTVFDK
jgi:serine/threonine protein kinase